MSTACCLVVLYICVKFSENILEGFRVMKRTRMKAALMDGQTEGIT